MLSFPLQFRHLWDLLLSNCLIKKEKTMAQTKDGKKKVYVKGYTKSNNEKVSPHYRSTPENTSTKKNTESNKK